MIFVIFCDSIDSVSCKLCFINLLVDLPRAHAVGEQTGQGRCLRSVRLYKELKCKFLLKIRDG
jgi:hypothetical protein